MMMTGAQCVTDALQREGVTVVFGIPGGHTIPLTDVMYDRPEMTFVVTRHEGGAACAADGYARASGRPGVCLATAGPGATNLLTGVGGALRDSSPVIVLTCNNQRKDIGFGDVQDANHEAIFAPLTKWSVTVNDVRAIPRVMREAFRRALTGAPGPVHIDFPREILAETLDASEEVEPEHYRPTTPLAPAPELVTRGVARLLEAARPVLWLGAGVQRARGSAAAVDFAEQLGLPVLTTFNAFGTVPTRHPLVFGARSRMGISLTQRILEEADLVVAVGNSLDAVSTSRWLLRLPALIHVDVEPLVLGRHYPFEIGIVGDARRTLEAFAAEAGRAGGSTARWAGWRETLASWQAEWRKGIYREEWDHATPMKPQTIMRALDAVLTPETTLCVDASNPGIWSLMLDLPRGLTYMRPVNFGNMGFALPAAIGAGLARPDQQVIALLGDGSLGMSLGELETAVRTGVRLAIVLMNNRVLGNIRQEQLYKLKAPRYIGVEFGEVDFPAVARACGGGGERVDRPEELPAALKRAVSSTVPYLLDITTDPDESVWNHPI
ncbi:MAG: thiamine pyrophosphate-binding protein [Candidatus Rokubacteria bacterium]|nr:thiamine pyrophosphate-binding protein [Candidatus Rokubacteria bacterium]